MVAISTSAASARSAEVNLVPFGSYASKALVVTSAAATMLAIAVASIFALMP